MSERGSARLRMLGLVLLIGGAVEVLAGTIDVGEYFPLGPRNSWRYTGIASPARALRITSRRAGAGARRFALTLPFEDVNVAAEVGYTSDGDLCLHRVAGTLTDRFGLPGAIDVKGDVSLDQPICLGGRTVSLGEEPIVAPIRGTVKVEVGVGPIDKSATFHLTGTASTTWSAGEPVDTPAGHFADVLGLALVLDLRIAGSVVGRHVDETLTERLTGTVARGTGLVLVRQQGDTFVLTQAIVGRGPVGGLCPPGRFLLPAGVQLVPGGAVAEDVIVVAPGQVAIQSGCEPTVLRASGKGTLVALRAKWPRCGQLKRVKLRATLDGTSCDRLVGTLIGRRSRTAFTALRSSCGDGVFDPEGERCDAGKGCDAEETCARACTCEAADGGSARGAILGPQGGQPPSSNPDESSSASSSRP